MSNVDGADLSGSYYESANRMKFGLPLASTWTNVIWGALEYREGYERSGELRYLLDAVKWVTDYFIAGHPEPFKFVGQVGDSLYDFEYCGPAEEYQSPRPVYWVTLPIFFCVVLIFWIDYP